MNIKGLFIDIDDTLIRFKQHATEGNTGSLLNVLVDAGVDLGGLERNVSEARVSWVQENIKWWSWEDFITKLDLKAEAFWEYAYEKEHCYLEPTEKELPKTLKSLKNMGFKLFATSNNPNSGIRHKLRLAGLTKHDINQLFTGILGATEMRHMKSDAEYWHRAVQASGIAHEDLAVIGDALYDDFEMPQSIGIAFTFFIDPDKTQSAKQNIQPVSGLNEVVSFILKQQYCV